MDEVIIKILTSVGILLLSWLTERVISLINTKIKNEKASKYLSEISLIVSDAVKSTYQEYVETLKNDGIFDLDAQQKALDIAKTKIQSELSSNMKSYIEKNMSDFETWIETAIHSELYDLKNK